MFPPKPEGGRAQFKVGIVGTLILKTDTQSHSMELRAKDLQGERDYERNRPMRLIEYHYQTAEKARMERLRLGVLDLPPKPVASIPGYSGWLPRRDATNVIGSTYKVGSLQAAELFAAEQESVHATVANILGPEKTLVTPDTLRQ